MEKINEINHKKISGFAFPISVSLFQTFCTLFVVYWTYHITSPGQYVLHNWKSMLGTWDGAWYITIARDGYPSVESTAFFPGYPLAIRFLHELTSLPFVWCGFLLSNLAMMGAFILLYRLWTNEFGTSISKRSIWLLATFPVSFFLTVVYTESFTLFALALFFTALKKDRWMLAMAAGGLAAVVHDLGILLGVPALAYWWTNRKVFPFWKNAMRFVSLTIIPLGLILYMVDLQIHFHNPLEFIHAQSIWKRTPIVPVWSSFAEIFSNLYLNFANKTLANDALVTFVNGIATLLFDAVAVSLWFDKKMSMGMKLFFTLTLLASTSSGTYGGSLESFARFVFVLFPAYPVLVRWCRNETVYTFVFAFFLIVHVFLTGLFGNGYVIT